MVLRFDLVGAHHLVVFVVSDVAVPDVAWSIAWSKLYMFVSAEGVPAPVVDPSIGAQANMNHCNLVKECCNGGRKRTRQSQNLGRVQAASSRKEANMFESYYKVHGEKGGKGSKHQKKTAASRTFDG
jgi:hypothetical protein